MARRNIKRAIFPGDWARHVLRRGMEPLKIWYIPDTDGYGAGKTGRPERAEIVLLYGGKRFPRAAVLRDGRRVTTKFMFPTKPVWKKTDEAFGYDFYDWVSFY